MESSLTFPISYWMWQCFVLQYSSGLVHGVSSQIQKIAGTMEPSDVDGSGITDDQTLKVALIAANRCTHEILEA